jgi:LmbE family N-acetylglucosaminyl deacetylase
MTTVDPARHDRALVVVAHTDDAEVNAGGTIALWTAAGVEVSYLVLTDGAAGGYGSVSRAEIVMTRRREQRAAADILGVADIHFLDGYPDGELEATADVVRDIVRVIRQVRPRRVMMMSTERDWSNIAQGHTDHLAAGEATIRAVYPAARNPFAFPALRSDEGLEPWTVDEVWIQAHPQPNHAEDVTDVVEQKLRAVRAHESQFPDVAAFADILRAEMTAHAARFALGDGRLAETFLRVRTA